MKLSLIKQAEPLAEMIMAGAVAPILLRTVRTNHEQNQLAAGTKILLGKFVFATLSCFYLLSRRSAGAVAQSSPVVPLGSQILNISHLYTGLLN
jgi:hypothetical protein